MLFVAGNGADTKVYGVLEGDVQQGQKIKLNYTPGQLDGYLHMLARVPVSRGLIMDRGMMVAVFKRLGLG